MGTGNIGRGRQLQRRSNVADRTPQTDRQTERDAQSIAEDDTEGKSSSETPAPESTIDDRCVVADGLSVVVSALYAEYLKWCESGGENADNKTKFGRRLESMRFPVVRSTGGTRIRRGIGLDRTGEYALGGAK